MQPILHQGNLSRVAEVRIVVIAVLGLGLIVAGVLSGDLGKSAFGAALLIVVSFMALIGRATARASRAPDSPWRCRDTAVVAVGSAIAVAVLGAAVVSAAR